MREKTVAYTISAYEKKVRKAWSYLTICGGVLSILASFTVFDITFSTFIRSKGSDLALNVTGSIFWTAAVYYCAFERFGTKLLTFFMFSTAICVVFAVFDIIKCLLITGSISFLLVCSSVFMQIYLAIWFFVSVKLRRMNKAIQKLIPEVVLAEEVKEQSP